MKSLEQASNEYLDRTEQQAEERSPRDTEEKRALLGKLALRMTEVPWEKEGTMKFSVRNSENGMETQVEIIYDSKRDEVLKEYLRTMPGPDFDDDRPTMAHYRRIVDMKIENDGYVFSFAQSMPKGWSIYSFVENLAELEKEPHSYSAVTLTGDNMKLIFVYSDITSPLGLQALLHEVSHAQIHDLDFGLYNYRQERNRSKRMLSSVGKAEIITDERNADAFSLSVLHRLFGKSIDIDGLKKIMYGAQDIYHKDHEVRK